MEDATPFLDQAGNGSFEAGADGVATGWSPVPGDAEGWKVEIGPSVEGVRAVHLQKAVWYCADWEPVRGRIRVEGQVRGDAVKDDGNPRHGAAVSLRLKGVPGADAYPVLGAWSGTFDWTPFRFAYDAPPEATDYRACVGLNSTTGDAWFDTVRAGSADRPPEAPVAVAGAFDAPGLDGWTLHPPGVAAPAVDTDAPFAGAGSLRVDTLTLLCTPWDDGAATLGLAGHARTLAAADGLQEHLGLVVQGRTRRPGRPERVHPVRRFAETPTWTPFREEWSVPEGEGEARLCIGRSGGAGTLWIDDVTAWSRRPGAGE